MTSGLVDGQRVSRRLGFPKACFRAIG